MQVDLADLRSMMREDIGGLALGSGILVTGIQSSILPQAMPRVPGLTIAAHYRPMTAVAGDFYDFLEMDGHRLGILVADVSGHGGSSRVDCVNDQSGAGRAA